jgi:hypothetical protein
MAVLEYLTLVEWAKKLYEAFPHLRTYLRTREFKQVFGRDAEKKCHVIYNISFPPEHTVFSKPEPKVKRDNYRRTQNLTTINSCATTRAIGYLVYAFGERVNKPPTISSDVDTDDRMDISFISVGGVTNLKSCDVLRDSSNHFLDFSGRSIVHRSSGLPIIQFSTEIAYGFIIKINPHSNPERTWICCAGFEERGTSGAAWFLATKWKHIRKWAKDKPFAIITKTDYHSDESTEFVYRFLTSDEVYEAAEKARATFTKTTTTTSKSETTQSTITAPPTPTQ